MKVLHVEAGMHLYGGARQVAYLLEGLEQRGVECVLVSSRGGAIGEELKDRISRLYEIPMRGDLDLGLIWRLKQIITQEQPNIVHLHSRRGADILGGLAARLSGVKVVLSRRVDNPEPHLVVRWKYRLYDRVITISEGIFKVLMNAGVAPEKLVCVRSAVSPDGYRTRCNRSWFHKAFDLTENETVLAVIAQLIPRKGHRYLLHALPALLETFPRIRVIFLGQGPQENSLRAQVNGMGLEDKVAFAGFRADLPKILPCLDLLVHPALMEGLGISLLQAAGAGVPIVAVNAGGMPEAVHDGVNGLLVAAGDPPALIEAITKLLSDRELMMRMGQAGRALVASEFSVDRMVEGNLRVYRDLLSASDD